MRVREVSRVKKGLISALASPRKFNQKNDKVNQQALQDGADQWTDGVH